MRRTVNGYGICSAFGRHLSDGVSGCRERHPLRYTFQLYISMGEGGALPSLLSIIRSLFSLIDIFRQYLYTIYYMI